MTHLDTIIIGAGQAGLATSYHLKMRKRDHHILEMERIGEAWRSEKWDSFTLVTPNWMLKLPGMVYDGDDPHGFARRYEVLRYLEYYAKKYELPVRTMYEAFSVEPDDGSPLFRIRTNRGTYKANNVVIATGSFRKPKIPEFSKAISPGITQLHSSEYRNPNNLKPGSILVVGSAQSGCQIADELSSYGRTVYISSGEADRLPRRYRGIDSFWWADQMGLFDQTPKDLHFPAARFKPNPQVSGKDGGKSLGLHELSMAGVHLLGSTKGADNSKIFLEDDLWEHIEQADRFEEQFKKNVDRIIEEREMNLPEEETGTSRAAYRVKPVFELDLAVSGISTIIWATGYYYDFSWIHFPVFGDAGYPIQEQGATDKSGLFFVGLHWLRTRRSGLFSGVGEDAELVAEHIATGSRPYPRRSISFSHKTTAG